MILLLQFLPHSQIHIETVEKTLCLWYITVKMTELQNIITKTNNFQHLLSDVTTYLSKHFEPARTTGAEIFEIMKNI